MKDQTGTNISWALILWSMAMFSGYCVVCWYGQASGRFHLNPGLELIGIFLLLFSGVAGLLMPLSSIAETYIKEKFATERERVKHIVEVEVEDAVDHLEQRTEDPV